MNEDSESGRRPSVFTTERLTKTLPGGSASSFECAFCHNTGRIYCSMCGNVVYCSRSCQIADWESHQTSCNRKSLLLKGAYDDASAPSAINLYTVKLRVNEFIENSSFHIDDIEHPSKTSPTAVADDSLSAIAKHAVPTKRTSIFIADLGADDNVRPAVVKEAVSKVKSQPPVKPVKRLVSASTKLPLSSFPKQQTSRQPSRTSSVSTTRSSASARDTSLFVASLTAGSASRPTAGRKVDANFAKHESTQEMKRIFAARKHVPDWMALEMVRRRTGGSASGSMFDAGDSSSAWGE